MSDSARHPELEAVLARVLDKGTWLASAVIGVGLILALFGAPGMLWVRAGVGLFIGLPILRLLVMLVVFWRDRDYRFGAIALFVLLIIGLGAWCATRMHGVAL